MALLAVSRMNSGAGHRLAAKYSLPRHGIESLSKRNDRPAEFMLTIPDVPGMNKRVVVSTKSWAMMNDVDRIQKN